MHLGTELTFLPQRHPEGFASDTETDRTVRRFARLLRQRKLPHAFSPKWEGFGAFKRIVEVTSNPIHSSNLADDGFMQSLIAVFDVARELDLSGRFARTRNGVTKVYSDGGGHIHSSIDVFDHDNHSHFLTNLIRFQRALLMDYANRPYIRWLFAHPFDNLNSKVTYTADTIDRNPVKRAYGGWGGITPRFPGQRRLSMPTFEHRYFGAPQTAGETLLNLVFVNNWILTLVKEVKEGGRAEVMLIPSYFRSLKQSRFAWREVSAFLRSINCNPAAYRETFERNYLTRMKWGEMR